MNIYVVEFEGSSKGSFQRAYTNIKDIYDDWVEFKRSQEESFKYEKENFFHNMNVEVEDQDLWFTIRSTEEDHSIGSRQKVIFNENKDLIKVSLKKLTPSDPEYVKNRWYVSRSYYQYKVKYGKIYAKYEG